MQGNEMILLIMLVLALALMVVVWARSGFNNIRVSQETVEERYNLHQALTQAQTDNVRLEAEKTSLVQQLQEQSAQLHELKTELQSLHRTHASTREKLIESQSKLQAQVQTNAVQVEQLQQSRKEFETFIKQYADASLNQKSEQLNVTNKQQLDLLLSPLRDQLGDFRKRVDHVYSQEAQDRRSLAEQVNQLKQLNAQLSSDAINLTKALKGDNKAQGNWGEMVLEKVLEQSGLRKGHEYQTQVNLTQTSGKRLQPDVVIHLPDNKDIVIDSKVSLLAYDSYNSAEDDSTRAQFLDAHLQSVKGHIANLSNKSYESAEGVRSLDYVLLFIPVESAYMLALQNDKGETLFVEAMQRNIMLVSPATLLMVLRTIHNIWRYEHQSQHAQDISRQAENLHKKMVGFVTSMETVGSQLHRAQESYDTAFKRLSSGPGNLINRAQNIVRLGGIKPKKQLREELLRQAQESDTQEGTDSSVLEIASDNDKLSQDDPT